MSSFQDLTYKLESFAAVLVLIIQRMARNANHFNPRFQVLLRQMKGPA